MINYDFMGLIENLIRLTLACLCGGLIGFEREQHANRPAGFRTHILVCIGSALVMIISEYIFKKYSGLTSVDPGRLGAQVISGIGFLGAGTIIRQGVTVKGLTTAASLWAVACVGLACGIGYYEGAIIATGLIYLTLQTLKGMERRMITKGEQAVLVIEVNHSNDEIGRITELFYSYEVKILNIGINDNIDTGSKILNYNLRLPSNFKYDKLISEIENMQNVIKIERKDI